MENAISHLKNAREKLSVKNLGNIKNMEKEMEEMYNIGVTGSGKINLQ